MLPLLSATNGALRWGVDTSESPQDALIEVEMLTVREGVVPVTALLYDFCRKIREFVNTPNVDPCPALILPTEVGRAATQMGLGEDKSPSSTLSFVFVESTTSTKCALEKWVGEEKRMKVLVEVRRYNSGGEVVGTHYSHTYPTYVSVWAPPVCS